MFEEIADPFGIFLIRFLAFDGFDILGMSEIGIQYLPVDSIQTSEQ